MDIVTYARDKNICGGLPLGVLYAAPTSPSNSPIPERRDHTLLPVSYSSSDVASSVCSDCGYHSDISSIDSYNHDVLKRVVSDGSSSTLVPSDEVWTRIPNPQPGILRVYAAYDTGLPKGASVKLHVTPQTTSREVVSIVVQQLHKAAIYQSFETSALMHHNPAANFPELVDLSEYCLVAVIGARERVIRDDYQPLQLQNPWVKGRLFVRLKSNLLAALNQGQVTTV